eukprot:12980314-Alexandrium_andersonii.AAC.1
MDEEQPTGQSATPRRCRADAARARMESTATAPGGCHCSSLPPVQVRHPQPPAIQRLRVYTSSWPL